VNDALQATLMQFGGRLHLVLLHLPIGIWFLLAVMEFGGAAIRRKVSRAVITVTAWVGALTAAVAAGSGWLLGLEEGAGGGTTDLVVYVGKSLEVHRWAGITFAALAVLAAAFAPLANRATFRFLTLMSLLAMTVTGHTGGDMVHGSGFLTEPFEQREERAPEAVNERPAESTTAQQPAEGVATGATFATQVQPILLRYCAKCHGEKKQKGDLALHTRAAIEAGGEGGAVYVGGSPDASTLLTLVELPIDDDDHMPPEDKPQPSPEDVATLRAWIAAGAPFEGSFTATGPTRPTRPSKPDGPEQPGQAGQQDSASPATPPSETPGSETSGSEQPGTEPPANEAPATERLAPQKPTTTPPVPRVQGGQDASPARSAGAGKQAANEHSDSADVPGRADQSAAIAALQERQVHVEGSAAAGTLLVDFGPVANAFAADELLALLTPLAACIQELSLARTSADDRCLELCGRMPHLRRLDVRRTKVSSQGLKALTVLTGLRELVVAQNPLDDGAVTTLLELPVLERLFVWQCGLSADALAELGRRAELHIDDGELVADNVLEVEPEVAFRNDLPPPGAEPQDEAAAARAALLRPKNATCPVSGQPVDPRYTIVHGDRTVGFCCPNCPKEFWGDPARFTVN
jgi:hypothetical protein